MESNQEVILGSPFHLIPFEYSLVLYKFSKHNFEIIVDQSTNSCGWHWDEDALLQTPWVFKWQAFCKACSQAVPSCVFARSATETAKYKDYAFQPWSAQNLPRAAAISRHLTTK
jgi:hypothetical protein